MLLDVSECFRDAAAMAWRRADWQRLGDYIVSSRQSRVPKMSRGDLAAAASISTRTLADIENGDLGGRKAFSPDTLSAISGVLNWPPGLWRAILNDDAGSIETAVFSGHASGHGTLQAGPKVDYVWTSPEVSLDEHELEEIEDEVEEYRNFLIERALRRNQAGKTAGQLEREANDGPEA